MARWLLLAILFVTCTTLAGCAAGREDTEVDQLWRSGAGFNNPNADRMRRGQNPLNFDGSEYRR